MPFEGSRMRALREDHEPPMSRERLGKLVSVSKDTIANWELGRSKPDDDALDRLADIFGVTTDYLLGRATAVRDTPPPYAEHLARGEEAYRARPMTVRIDLPLLGEVPAGPADLAVDYIEEYLPVDPALVADDPQGYYWLRIKGKSMSMDGITDKGKILVHRQPDVEDYQVAVVRIDNTEATVKRVKHLNGKLQLIPAHPSMEVQELDASRVCIVGRVKLAQTEF